MRHIVNYLKLQSSNQNAQMLYSAGHLSRLNHQIDPNTSPKVKFEQDRLFRPLPPPLTSYVIPRHFTGSEPDTHLNVSPHIRQSVMPSQATTPQDEAAVLDSK